MSMLPSTKGDLRIPRAFEMIPAGEWKMLEINGINEMVGAEVSSAIFLVVCNAVTGRSYIGNFAFPNLNEANQENFISMINSITEHEADSRLGAYVGGASLSGKKGPDGTDIDEIILEAREFTASTISDLVMPSEVYFEWLPDGKRFPFIGFSPEGKFYRLAPED